MLKNGERPFLEIESDGTACGTSITYDSHELRGLTEVILVAKRDDSIVEFNMGFDLSVDDKDFAPIIVENHVEMFDVETIYVKTNGFSSHTLIVLNGKPLGFATEFKIMVSDQNPDSIKLEFKSLDSHLDGKIICAEPVQFVYHNKKLYKYLPNLAQAFNKPFPA